VATKFSIACAVAVRTVRKPFDGGLLSGQIVQRDVHSKAAIISAVGFERNDAPTFAPKPWPAGSNTHRSSHRYSKNQHVCDLEPVRPKATSDLILWRVFVQP